MQRMGWAAHVAPLQAERWHSHSAPRQSHCWPLPAGGWGNLRNYANAALMMLIHAKHTPNPAIRQACIAWAQQHIDRILGLSG